MSKLRGYFTLLQMIISVSIVIILMFLFKKHNHTIRKKWAQIQMNLLGVKIKLTGTIDPEARMVVMNHQSILDIVVIEYLHSKNLAWVAKKEISNIPWFGKIISLPDMISIERESKSSLIKLLKDSKDRLSHNRPIAIFPEGTRTDGKSMRKFKSGPKIIAEKFKLKVQPVVIYNTIEILDSKNLTQKSGIVQIDFLSSIQAEATTNWYEEVEKNMNEVFNSRLQNDN